MIDLKEKTWEILLERIRDKKCTPFLGAGACAGALPLGGELSRDLADEQNYPFEDRGDLLRVAQFIAVKSDPPRAKSMVVDRLKKAGPPKFANPPNFTVPDDPHGVLASLNLPVYLTTNYDDFMFRALRAAEKDPRREVCRWHDGISKFPSVFETEPAYHPSPANPLVFHLHGYDKEPDFIVLTEDDYLKFMINLARDPALLPPFVQAAISASTLLFVGYRLADWNFRVLFQMLRPEPQYISVAVLLPPGPNEPSPEEAQQYLDEYYAEMNLKMFWGTAREFSLELRRRWAEFRTCAE
jgi:SIR2-like domain